MPENGRNLPDPENHPFAEFLRTVGRGPTLSRPLDMTEAEAAMGMILDGEVEPVQFGALMLLLRYRGETPEELAGFVRAARARLALPGSLAVDLDWPSSADRHKQLPYFLLAALLLGINGVRVLLHTMAGAGPASTPRALAALGVPPAAGPDEAARALDEHGFAWFRLADLCRPLDDLFAWRPMLGVRSPANTFVRDLNPAAAPAQVIGVFHPAYLPVHCRTAELLGQPRAAIFRGGGGEAQRNPEKPCRALMLRDGVSATAEWPVLTPGSRHPWRHESLDPAALAALWRGESELPGPEAAVVGTAALVLDLLGRADGQAAASALARDMWAARPRDRFGS